MISHRLRWVHVLMAMTLSVSALTGCTGDDDTGPSGPLEEITYLTGFSTFGREAPVYVADQKGYFEEAGIEVDIQPGDGTIKNVPQVVEGKADFALGDLTGLILGVGNEEMPEDFRAVAAIQQQTVFAIMALKGNGITNPQDLEGKTIGDAVASFAPLLFPTYAELAGFNADKVNYDASFEPPALPGLLGSEQVDAVGQFVMGKPTLEASAGGRETVVLPFSDVLRDLYGNVLVTSTETIKKKRDLVRRFVRALMRGIKYATANPQEAGIIMAEYVPETNPEVAAQELELMAPYVQPLDPAAPIGDISGIRVSKAIGTLESAGAIPEGVTPEDVVSFELTPGGSKN